MTTKDECFKNVRRERKKVVAGFSRRKMLVMILRPLDETKQKRKAANGLSLSSSADTYRFSLSLSLSLSLLSGQHDHDDDSDVAAQTAGSSPTWFLFDCYPLSQNFPLSLLMPG